MVRRSGLLMMMQLANNYKFDNDLTRLGCWAVAPRYICNEYCPENTREERPGNMRQVIPRLLTWDCSAFIKNKKAIKEDVLWQTLNKLQLTRLTTSF